MKVSPIFLVFNVIIITVCYGMTDKNLKNNLHDGKIRVEKNNLTADSNELYFPLQYFPEIKYTFIYEDSSTKLVSTTIGSIKKGDTLRMYAKIVPNEFDTFSIRWYSKHLFALNEQVLFNKPTEKEVFRFLWLRTFHNPISIRIEKINNDYSLYWKVCDGAGGYSPGTLITDKQKKIKKAHWDKFQNLLLTLDYWNLQNNGNALGLDGSHWILEGSTPDNYQVIDEWSPGENGIYYEVCNYLIELTGLKIKKKNKY